MASSQQQLSIDFDLYLIEQINKIAETDDSILVLIMTTKKNSHSAQFIQVFLQL
jgi:hypothetical protein